MIEPFGYRKRIVIDDSGWGDIILGVVIGALEFPAHRYMERRIPVAYFQPPLFERKEYLARTEVIVREIIEVMKADRATLFQVCSGYVLSAARRFLREEGYPVEEVEVTGELQERVERSFLKWCMEVGVPQDVLSPESGKNRFWALLKWVGDNPKAREGLVKTGWKSWQRKWRKVAYEEGGVVP